VPRTCPMAPRWRCAARADHRSDDTTDTAPAIKDERDRTKSGAAELGYTAARSRPHRLRRRLPADRPAAPELTRDCSDTLNNPAGEIKTCPGLG